MFQADARRKWGTRPLVFLHARHLSLTSFFKEKQQKSCFCLILFLHFFANFCEVVCQDILYGDLCYFCFLCYISHPQRDKIWCVRCSSLSCGGEHASWFTVTLCGMVDFHTARPCLTPFFLKTTNLVVCGKKKEHMPVLDVQDSQSRRPWVRLLLF